MIKEVKSINHSHKRYAKDEITAFLKSGYKYGKVTVDGVSSTALRANLYTYAKKHDFNVKVYMVDHEVYLERI